tara:strand:+ start:1837 stop:2037 length:201 start_codon:yes stop_codon:yes gene_type:complete
MEVRKIRKQGKELTLSIPPRLAQALSLLPGEYVQLEHIDKHIKVSKITQEAPEATTAYSPSWQRRK